LQLRYGSDVVICLDQCTHVDDDAQIQEQSVRRTVQWARRCKREFSRLVSEAPASGERRPLLFAVIQGGASLELRRQCAEQLLELGFDGFGYGGWPFDSEGRLLEDVIAYTRELVPSSIPMHALGIVHPENIAMCRKMGYTLFDSALPTRDARHGRLYTWKGDGAALDPLAGSGAFGYSYVLDDRFSKSTRPAWSGCDCHTCTHYSLGYLHHLATTKETLFARLATIHNLRFIVLWMHALRGAQRA
jgi:queuine tRNA-ribosyltransferase